MPSSMPGTGAVGKAGAEADWAFRAGPCSSFHRHILSVPLSPPDLRGDPWVQTQLPQPPADLQGRSSSSPPHHTPTWMGLGNGHGRTWFKRPLRCWGAAEL